MALVSLPFKIVLEWDADDHVWVSHVPALGDISTYGDTLEEAVSQTREAILGYLETAAEEQIPLPDESALLRAALERRPAAV
ncbi:MAG TPA: type II toxin-antitoxin system HicB family antitoxin [Bryobacteraceae bacterium]|nr:type II toxin-antitoxin system HicB family antitoxin [Bryobacteraceae bacterium]